MLTTMRMPGVLFLSAASWALQLIRPMNISLSGASEVAPKAL
jgi:hypothetical protein